MRNISDTIARLSALRARHSAHVPNHGRQDRLQDLTDFGSNPGSLKGRFHLPPSLPKNAPLVVVLHGCTQNPAGYDHHSGWSQLADEAGFALLFPEQQRSNNPNLCFNWFEPADTGRDMGEAFSIRQMIEAVVLRHGLDRKRIFITGLSAGGAMAAAMLASYPAVFAGGAIIAGLPYGSATTIPQAFDRMRGHGSPSGKELQRMLHRASDHRGPWPRISIWQGTADQTVAPSNAEAVAAQWLGVHGFDKKTPTRSETAGRLAKRIWCDAAGEAIVEINMIADMGHGTPIGDGLGAPGPFMLDARISSTREIARFWNIDAARTNGSTRSSLRVAAGESPSACSPSLALEKAAAKLPVPSDGDVSKPRPEQDPHGIKTVIEDALRAAGLMR
ncbi:MAG: PHB depolymerase family esterase [Rhizobiaceae bacterium]|nr:MAG: PHB depolymerase family esterase [Rhizobiaceae bacterium]